MHLKSIFILLFLAVAGFILATDMDADAARFGGGKSFGGSPSMSSPAPMQSVQPKAMPNQNKQSNIGGGAQAQPRSGGMFGGMGGMLGGLAGGLLAGSLLGSLFSGSGFAGGGFMDILLFGLAIYIGLKVYAAFKAKRGAPKESTSAYQSTFNNQSPYSGGQSYQPQYGSANSYQPSHYSSQNSFKDDEKPEPTQRQSETGSIWSKLQGNDSAPKTESSNMWGSLQNSAPEPETTTQTSTIPDNFDQEEFLRGAKMAYTRLQTAWDKRDLKDIAQFSGPAVQKEIEAQCAEDPTPSKTEILLINAQLMSVTEASEQQTATVYFDVLLREDTSKQSSTQVREVWHFIRPVNGSGSWKLEGIQQVA